MIFKVNDTVEVISNNIRRGQKGRITNIHEDAEVTYAVLFQDAATGFFHEDELRPVKLESNPKTGRRSKTSS